MAATGRKERHADDEGVRLRIEEAELRHPARAERPGCIAGRRNDVRVIHLGGEYGGDEAEDKKKNVPGSFHKETFPGTGNMRNRHRKGLIPVCSVLGACVERTTEH